MAGKSKSGGGNRKHGRNKVFCTKYKAEDRRTKNKIRRLKRHLRDDRHGYTDIHARAALRKLIGPKAVMLLAA